VYRSIRVIRSMRYPPVWLTEILRDCFSSIPPPREPRLSGRGGIGTAVLAKREANRTPPVRVGGSMWWTVALAGVTDPPGSSWCVLSRVGWRNVRAMGEGMRGRV